MSKIHPLTMPKWGLSMAEGRIGEWRVLEGMSVESGAELVGVETDKIFSPLEAPASGILRRIVARKDDLVPVAGLIAVIADATFPDEEIDAFITDFKARFVPEQSEQADAVSSTIQVQVGAQSLCYLKRGEGTEAGPAYSWLRRRPQQLALQSRGAGG
jgi:pyruvate dehydrogenase E2 component (dihydrolipoamide acetyltransferase)